MLDHRRPQRSLDNFLNDYALAIDQAVCHCNTGKSPVVVFTQHGEHREVAEPAILRGLEKTLENRRQRNSHGQV